MRVTSYIQNWNYLVERLIIKNKLKGNTDIGRSCRELHFQKGYRFSLPSIVLMITRLIVKVYHTFSIPMCMASEFPVHSRSLKFLDAGLIKDVFQIEHFYDSKRHAKWNTNDFSISLEGNWSAQGPVTPQNSSQLSIQSHHLNNNRHELWADLNHLKKIPSWITVTVSSSCKSSSSAVCLEYS